MPTPRKRGRASPNQSSSPPPASTPKRLKTAARGGATPSTTQRTVSQKRQTEEVVIGSDDELDLLGGTDSAGSPAGEAQIGDAMNGQDEGTGGIAATEAAAPPASSPSQGLLGRREAILNRLSGQVTSPEDLVGLDEQAAVLRQTLHATVRRGESNSILLVGAKGSGKSAIFNATLSSLGPRTSYHHVYVSARQCTTDRAAMRELARQLIQSGAFNLHDAETRLNLDEEEDRDEEGEGEEEELEALDEEEEAVRREALGNAVLSSLSNTTSSILALLASASSTSASGSSAKPLIISLDSFDLLTARPRQALLYCLLDAVQSGTYRPGLAIVGMTRRVDTTDLLEKRVKSRFSHRIVQCYPPASEDEWREVVRKALLCAPPENKALENTWQGNTASLLEDRDFTSLLGRITDQSKDVHHLFTVLYPPIAALPSSPPEPLSAHPFILSYAAQQNDATLSSLYDLPTLPFLLLIAAKHLQTRDRTVFNFEVCFDEVARFSRKSRRNREGAGTGGMGLNMDEGNEDSVLPSEGVARRGVAKRAKAAVGEGEGEEVRGGEWEDRKRALMAFDQLLALDLFLPDAFLSTLAYGPTTIATTTTTGTAMGTSCKSASSSTTTTTRSAAATATAAPLIASSLRTGAGASSVRKEYLRVRSIIEPQVVLAVARERGKRGTLGSEVVQWASRGG
ncbi:hypothetical protein BCV69DRAFT_310857 [Microstroma glucosiphilum]|uniref:Uncharacterized protein n=1 Tax=Pseudomicrostroma glucosiphilum TaxID=1684307 RepID=A0A316UDQ8_9BASI|nr:hypothetical protein BCV69DRAFT_310857 [Pseudomicrostroma glucosiphilum]PWN23397.1 hypothetical protein BCV69DRAFT_310857 [Pseudomicrostroma glucosiphilum]